MLITSFGPFGGWPANPTEAVADAVAAAIGARRLHLPVDLQAASALLSDVAGPVLALGLHGGASALHVEVRAWNEARFRIPDASGRQPQGEPLSPAGPPWLETSRPVATLVAAARRHAPACRSADPGRYLCNAVYWRLLERQIDAVFVHLPRTPGLTPAGAVEHAALGRPLPLPVQIAAVRALASA